MHKGQPFPNQWLPDHEALTPVHTPPQTNIGGGIRGGLPSKN